MCIGLQPIIPLQQQQSEHQEGPIQVDQKPLHFLQILQGQILCSVLFQLLVHRLAN